MKPFRNLMIFVKVVGAFLIVAAGGIYIGYYGIQAISGAATQSAEETVHTTNLLMIGLAVLALLLGIYISNIIAAVNDMARRISAGDTDSKKKALASGKLFSSFVGILTAIQALIADTKMLTDAAIEGSLSTRADATKHQGDYRKIIEGINNTLDAVTQPMSEASYALSEMAKGNLNVSVTGDYKGDHATFKNATNDTLAALRGYIGEVSTVLGEMSRGNLHVDIESEYKGDFSELKHSINLTLKALRGYIGEISTVLSDMSKGNFDVSITSEYMGEFVQLKNSINGIVTSLNEVLGEINLAAEQVSAGTSQVSDGNQAISQGATEQASSIEQLTATVTEIARQTKQNALSANEANDTSTEAKTSATVGNEQMAALQQAMHDLSESSASISKIIKAIDDIAFQTNILALNAAVEAARAGMHGKGFAVVAEEVRNLAARSAGAAKETANLIEGSIKKTEAGTRIADQAAAALAKIMENVDKAVTLVGEIAASSNQQANAILEVNKGIEQMSQVVQTNSATSQEAAAAAQELSSQAAMLKSMVGRFHFKSGAELPRTKEPMAIGSGTATSKTDAIDLDGAEFGKY